MLKTITVKLYEKAAGDQYTDPFNAAAGGYAAAVDVSGVLVYPASSDDMINELNLSGKRIVYTLSIPKGDAHTWTGAKVEFFNRTWAVVGTPQEWIEANVPLKWNKKVQVESIE